MIGRMCTPFKGAELTVIGQKDGIMPNLPKSPIYNTPISYRENVLSLFTDKRPMFAVRSSDFSLVAIPSFNDHLSRGRDVDDVFGVHWTFVSEVGGSISHGGNPKFEDANDWRDSITIPDASSWDWKGDAEKFTPDTRFACKVAMANGFGFERLISLMDFMNAAIAVADEDQAEALDDLLKSLYDLGIECLKNIFEYFPYVDLIQFHDDWGSQKNPFFSEEVAREHFLPHMKRFCDYVHANGRFVELHSCGHVDERINIFIEAGIDTWQMQTMNDFVDLYNKYGDKMVIQIPVEEFKQFDFSDDEQAKAAARYYVDNFCEKGKPSICVIRDIAENLPFQNELYRYSREHYLAQ